MVGIQGSGKSTLSKKLAQELDIIISSTDQHITYFMCFCSETPYSMYVVES